MSDFVLRPGLDAEGLAQAFAREGRLQIVDFLRHDGALALFRELTASTAWRLAVNRGEEVKDHPEAEIAAWTADKKAELDRSVIEGGRHGFQFRYHTIRLPEYGSGWEEGTAPLLRSFVDFLCSEPVVAFMRTVTGAADVTFADGHASRYQAGHFLTAHDDTNVDMGRRAAYVLNLTPQWRPDWGGILQFYDERGNVVRGFTPAFNVLNIFRVPQPHSVSWVTPLAVAPRYAVTGWLRTGRRA
ncbi:MAG TPA: 2OG-Fe(II) oxygenase family protein [Allosphingosinicella sp.]|jgi:prepilin-type processing-associated H-X9-DG protein|nr:2OG-Fe(II) oxygenase family protein [Allosphingosinicella sp.]